MFSFYILKSNPEEEFWKWFTKNEKFIYDNFENQQAKKHFLIT